MSAIRDIILNHGGSFDGVKDKSSFLLPIESYMQALHQISIASQRMIKVSDEIKGGWIRCRVVKERKPYKVIRVNDRSATNNINPHLIMRVDPTGAVEVREKGRKTGFKTTVAAIYIRCMMNEVNKRQLEKARQKKAKRRRK